MVINHPSNPTGGGTTVEELRAIAKACEEHDVLLISDEVYRDLYVGSRGPTLRDVTKAGAVVSSASKGFGAPGLRLGWIVADPRWLEPVRMMHAYAVTSAAMPSQLADPRAPSKRRLGSRRGARPSPRALGCARGRVPRASRSHDRASRRRVLPLGPPPRSARKDPFAFAIRLRDSAKVVIIPGLAFGEGGRGHARISFAAKPDVIAEGIRRLAPYWR